MFGTFDNLRAGTCRRCRGEGRLQVVIQTLGGRFVGYGPDITCDACDGKGRFKSAAADFASERQ